MNNSLVTVIMPVYNAEKFVKDAIQSVINQTYTNWELIIVDDASVDNSKNIIQNISAFEPRIKYITLAENSGAAIARNTAMEKASGTLIAFLDADDIWKKNKLEIQTQFMLKNNCVLCFSAYEVIDEFGNESGKFITAPLTVNYRQLLKTNTIGCLTVMYNVEKCGRQYMPDIRMRQDYGLWLNILKPGNIALGIQESLAYYRVTKKSMSGNKLGVLKYNWQILRKHQQLNLFASTYYFSCFIINKISKYYL